MENKMKDRAIGLEIVSGEEQGRDPRKMKPAELEALGHKEMPLRRAARLFCVECAGASAAEALKCVAVNCQLWPFRMATNPWRKPLPEAERQRRADVFAATRRYAAEARELPGAEREE
jgi:hypothetical protein